MPEPAINLRPYTQAPQALGGLDPALRRRAREKLASARARSTPDAPTLIARKRFFTPGRLLLGWFGLIALNFALGFYLRNGPVALVSMALGYLTIYMSPILMATWGVFRNRLDAPRIAELAPTAPDAAVRALLRLGPVAPKLAWDVLLPEERDDWPRPPAHWVVPGASPHPGARFDDAAMLGDYWRAVLGRGPNLLVAADCTTLGVKQVAPDLCSVDIEFGANARSLRTLKAAGIALVAGLLGFSYAVAVWVMTLQGYKELGNPALAVLAGVGAIGLAFMTCLLAFMPQPLGSVRVRKLAIRVAGKWYPFNGELMGAEEADLSWIDEP